MMDFPSHKVIVMPRSKSIIKPAVLARFMTIAWLLICSTSYLNAETIKQATAPLQPATALLVNASETDSGAQQSATFLEPQNSPISGGLELQSVTGPRSLLDFQGKVVVLFFGYTHCPDVCPRDLGIMAEAFTGLDEKQLQRAQGVFVSLDPERDDAKTLDQFTHYFNPNFVGLTGSATQIKQLAERFGIHYKKVPVPGSVLEYGLEHTASIYVLDAAGRLSFVLPNGIAPSGLQQVIQFLLNETQS